MKTVGSIFLGIVAGIVTYVTVQLATNFSTAISNIFIGVVSGIITYVLIRLAVEFFYDIVVPWYQKRIYLGQNIAGEWELHDAQIIPAGEYQALPETRGTIDLKQHGNRVDGELLLTKQKNGEVCRKVFRLKGFFVDMALTMDVRAKDDMGVGTFVMKLGDGRKKLQGKWSFVSAHDGVSIDVHDIILVRKN